ncbi:MAG: S-layer homology domain-containing protein [Clostridia bacterium]|nr:S-layer homology domain-containing protein [Clostridia bacterium]
MKRFTALSLAAVMTLSMAVNASAATFSDINNVPWEGAKEYINSVADLGLMVGDTDSAGNKVFRAKDRITYCEAMQLAYSVLTKTSALKTTADTQEKWKSAMQEANIPTWAYPAVSYGLESGIVSANDIKIFIKSDGTSRDATRENVGVIFGKALSHISAANASAVLSFGDKAEISATSVPYIDLLARLNILVGDENGNFNPKNYINRAEMAVIASKSYNKINEIKKEQTTVTPSVERVSGTVILTDNGTSEKTIAVSDKDSGKVSTFTINASTPVITIEGAAKTYEDISVGDVITLAVSNGIVASIVINEDDESNKEEQKERVLEGYLNNITTKVVTFDTEDGDQERYEFSSNPRITLNGSIVTKDDIYDYLVDRNMIYVEVGLDSAGQVSSLSARFCDVEGELTNVKDGYVYVKYEYAEKTKTAKIEIASSCEIYIDSEKASESKAEKLFTNEDEGSLYVQVEVNNFNKAIKIEIFHDNYSNGELVSISSSSIEIKSSFGRVVEYDFADDAELTLNGGEASYRDIKTALKSSDILITLEFDKEGNVTKAAAQAKTAKGELKAADEKRIVIVDENDARMVLPVDRNTEYEYNNEDVVSSKFQKLYKAAESKVVAVAELDENGTVIRVEAQEGSDSEGVVTSISSSEIVFEDVAGIEHKYKIEPAMVGYLNGEKLGKASAAIEYARQDGATVKVTFSSRGYVNRIYVTLED